MNASMRHSTIWLLPTMAVATVGFGYWEERLVGAESASYFPTSLELIPTKVPQLILFPTAGPQVTVPLPAGLPADLRLIEFSPDGTAIYVQSLGGWDRITKIEFRPARQRIIRGSVGVGTILSLVVLHKPERILVSGVAKSRGKVECGVFEIDPDGGEFRQLLDGKFPDCGGFISPDGKRVLRLQKLGNQLSVLDLATGAVQAIGDGLSWADWSPDGQWIATVLDYHRVVLIDATDTSRRRNLGRTEDNQVQWSPDSKYLLLAKSELLCGGELSSLEALDVRTGKRSQIKSSHCNILATTFGWMDPEAVR
jgi:WD40 repeat protein